MRVDFIFGIIIREKIMYKAELHDSDIFHKTWLVPIDFLSSADNKE